MVSIRGGQLSDHEVALQSATFGLYQFSDHARTKTGPENKSVFSDGTDSDHAAKQSATVGCCPNPHHMVMIRLDRNSALILYIGQGPKLG